MADAEIKDREIQHQDLSYHKETSEFRGSVSTKNITYLGVRSRQITTSRNNGRDWRWSRDYLRRYRESGGQRARSGNILSMQDFGGAFETVSHLYQDEGIGNVALTQGTSIVRRYRGPVKVFGGLGPDSYLWPKAPSDLSERMVAKGTTAIARTVPTNPASGVAQFLGELREGLPSIPGRQLATSRRNSAAKLADEYLNLEFGLRPIVSDLREFHGAIRDSNKILEQLRRDSGRLVRRRYRFPVEVKEEVMSGPTETRTTWPALDSNFYTSFTGAYTWRRKTTTEYWFSGAYTYFYDQGQDLWSRARQAEQNMNALFGLRINPQLLWELAPWSWLVDWKTNVGDVMTNLSAFSRDQLVLRWGYVMATETITDTHSVRCGLRGYEGRTLSESFTTVVKKRVKATPYGFGLDPDWKDFSVRQLAILGALGVTRASS